MSETSTTNNFHIYSISSTISIEGDSKYTCLSVAVNASTNSLPNISIVVSEKNSKIDDDNSLEILTANNIKALATTIQDLMLNQSNINTGPITLSVEYTVTKGTATPVNIKDLNLFPTKCTLAYNARGDLTCIIQATSQLAVINTLDANLYTTHPDVETAIPYNGNIRSCYWVSKLDDSVFKPTDKINLLEIIITLLNKAKTYEVPAPSDKFDDVVLANLTRMKNANDSVFDRVIALLEQIKTNSTGDNAYVLGKNMPEITKEGVIAIYNAVHTILFSPGLLFGNIITLCNNFDVHFFPAAITSGKLDLKGSFKILDYVAVKDGDSNSSLDVIPEDFIFNTGSNVAGSLYPSAATYVADLSVITAIPSNGTKPFYATYPTTTTRALGRSVTRKTPYWCIPVLTSNKNSSSGGSSSTAAPNLDEDLSKASDVNRDADVAITVNTTLVTQQTDYNTQVLTLLQNLAEQLYFKLLLSDSNSAINCHLSKASSSVSMGDVVKVTSDNYHLFTGILTSMQLTYTNSDISTGLTFTSSVYPGVALK